MLVLVFIFVLARVCLLVLFRGSGTEVVFVG